MKGGKKRKKVKNRNSMGLTEAEEVAKTHRRTTLKGLNDPDNHDGVVTHLEPDILGHKETLL